MKGNVIISLDSVNLNEFLKHSYKELFKSIEKEGYNLDFQNFDSFHEIMCEDKVVGFFTLEKSNLFNSKSINECYIIPKYRGNKLFYDYLLDLIQSSSYNIYVKKPNHSFIQALIKYGLAYKLNNNFVMSFIHFDVELSSVYKNSKIKHFYKKISKENENIHYIADLFDLDLNCILFKDNLSICSKNNDTLVILEPRKYDLKKYKCRKKLKKINTKYLNNIWFEIEETIPDAMDFFDDLKDRLNEYLTVNNIIGSENELNADVVDFLDDNELTVNDGFKIRQSIVNAINSGDIENSSIKTRFGFLVSHPEYVKKTKSDTNLKWICPFCKRPISNTLDLCDNCGQKIDFNSFEIMDIMNNDYSYKKDNYSIDNNFLNQLKDFSENFSKYIGETYDEFKLNHDDKGYYFKDDTKLDNWILRIVKKNNYDKDEVFDAQSRISTFEAVKHINDNITSWKMDNLTLLNHVNFDYIQDAFNLGYIKKIMPNEFTDNFSKYSIEELKEELKYFDIKPKESKEEILNQLKDEGDFSYIITQKGIDYLNNHQMLDYFATYLPEFIFYEFENYYNTNRDKLSLEEIGENYLMEKFEKSINDNNLDGYLKYLEYHYMQNKNKQDYNKALYYLIQRIIYEVNKWYSKDSHHSFEVATSIKTGDYFHEMHILNKDFDLDKIYNNAFDEFKFNELKGHKEKIHGFVSRLLNGEHIVNIEDDLIEEYFEDK